MGDHANRMGSRATTGLQHFGGSQQLQEAILCRHTDFQLQHVLLGILCGLFLSFLFPSRHVICDHVEISCFSSRQFHPTRHHAPVFIADYLRAHLTEIVMVNVPSWTSFCTLRDFEPTVTSRLLLAYTAHVLLLVITIVILITGKCGWEQGVSIDPAKANSIQSAINAIFQAFFTAVLALMFWLSQTIAISRTLRETRSLLMMHFTVGAWASFASVIPSLARLATSKVTGMLRNLALLTAIFLYFVVGSTLQITSSSVIGIEIYSIATPIVNGAGLNSIGNYNNAILDGRILESDLKEPITSEQNTSTFHRKLWQAVRLSMFSAEANNTLKPGIEGRIIHDTISPYFAGFDVATVNATGMNVRCSQPTEANYTAFMLPVNSTDFKNAVYIDKHGFLNATNLDYLVSIWLNVSLNTPPYWNASVPGVNVIQKWLDSPFTDYRIPNLHKKIPTRMFMQPWNFPPRNGRVPFGHQQVVMVLATSPESLVHGTNGVGRIHNISVDLSLTESACSKCIADGTCGESTWACTPGLMAGSVQIIGCDFWTDQISINITSAGLLAHNTVNWNSTSRLARAWSDFEWKSQSSVDMDRQFLTIFSPSAPGDMPNPNDVSVFEWGLSPSERLLSRLFMANQLTNPSNVTIEMLEDAMEHYAASYFWSYRNICDSNDSGQSPLALATLFADGACVFFRDSDVDAYLQSGRNATLWSQETRARLKIVNWRAYASVGCSFALCVLALFLLGIPNTCSPHPSHADQAVISTESVSQAALNECSPFSLSESLTEEQISTKAESLRSGGNLRHYELQHAGLVDVIRFMQHSSLPETLGGIPNGVLNKTNISVRYGVNGDHANIDIDEAQK